MAKDAAKPPIDEAPEGRSVAPGELRGRLAADLGEDYGLLADTLRTAMGEATKDHWIACRDCGKKSIYTAPDYRTRLDAAQRWLELGLGRKREEVASPTRSLSELGGRDFKDMSDEELEAIAAGDFVDDGAANPDELEKARQQELANGGTRR